MLFTVVMRKKISLRFLALGFVLLFTSLVSCDNAPETPSKSHVKVVLREVGHQLLLKNLDSTSVVLPVIQLEPNIYKLSFLKNMAFLPNDLVLILNESLKKGQLDNNNYRVEVIECNSNEVAYSYEISLKKENIIVPCLGRLLPHNCYNIQLSFLNAKSTGFDKKWVFYLLCIGVLALVMLRFLKSKDLKEDIITTKDYIAIGNCKFYPEQLLLTVNDEDITLSKKECEILELLASQPNQIISRDTLTKKVWEDNGVIVGRSLDTYISKLRKKLKADPALKLSNVHGVGYKLEIESKYYLKLNFI